MNRILDDVVGKVVGLPMVDPWLEPTTGNPGAEAATVVIPAVVVFGEFTLTVDGAAELAAEDDNGIFEQATLFKILDQSGSRLIDGFTIVRQVLWQIVVLIPASMKELNKAYTALSHPSGENAVRGEGAFVSRFGAVEVVDMIRLLFGIHQIRHRCLHAKCHFVLGYTGLDFRIPHPFKTLLIQVAQTVEHGAA